MRHYDILIAGGGLAGNCLALALKDSGMHLAIIEANTRDQQKVAPAGDRALALAAGTVVLLRQLGIWQGIAHIATAIKAIHVSDQGHFGKTRLSADDEQEEALGYVITARDLEGHVADLTSAASIELISPARVDGVVSSGDLVSVNLALADGKDTITAKLLVGADGGLSSVRKLLQISQTIVDYGQTALVTTVQSALPNRNVAYERFTSSGPLALLPMGSRCSSVVWTRGQQDADSLLACSEDAFIGQLQQCFGYKLGQLTLVAPRRAFPLSLIRAEKMFSGRTVIIGNAVHQLHPVAGQGFNLGLRDVVFLAEKLLDQCEQGKDLGAYELLHNFSEARKQDHDRTIFLTDQLIKIFSNDALPLSAARNAGMLLLDHWPSMKSLLARQTMGFAGKWPNLLGRR